MTTNATEAFALRASIARRTRPATAAPAAFPTTLNPMNAAICTAVCSAVVRSSARSSASMIRGQRSGSSSRQLDRVNEQLAPFHLGHLIAPARRWIDKQQYWLLAQPADRLAGLAPVVSVQQAVSGARASSGERRAGGASCR